MSEASYTAWDDNLYEWPPPDGWYQADDEKWWPEGYGPAAGGSADDLLTPDGDDDGASPLLFEVERTSIFPAGGTGLLGMNANDEGDDSESQRPVYDELPSIDDVFGGADPYADDDDDDDDDAVEGDDQAQLLADELPPIDDLPGLADEDPDPESFAEEAQEADDADDDDLLGELLADDDRLEDDELPNDGLEDGELVGEAEDAPDLDDDEAVAHGLIDQDPVDDYETFDADDDPSDEFDEFDDHPVSDHPDDVGHDEAGPGDGFDVAATVSGLHLGELPPERDLDLEAIAHLDPDLDDADLDLEDPDADPDLDDPDADLHLDDPDAELDPGLHHPDLDDSGEHRAGEEAFATVDAGTAARESGAGETSSRAGAMATGDHGLQTDRLTDPDLEGRHTDEIDSGERRRSAWPMVAAGLAVLLVGVGLGAYVLLGGDDAPIGFDAQAAQAETGAGSLGEPYSAGTGIVVFYNDEVSGEERRWVIQVIDPVVDGTEQMVADGEVTAPGQGEVLALTRVRVTYQSGPTPGRFADLEFGSIGSSLELFEDADSCSSVPDGLDPATTLEPGQGVEGNLCWEVPSSDLADLKLAVQAGPVDGIVFMSLV